MAVCSPADGHFLFADGEIADELDHGEQQDGHLERALAHGAGDGAAESHDRQDEKNGQHAAITLERGMVPQ